jgi:hypothetical protein
MFDILSRAQRKIVEQYDLPGFAGEQLVGNMRTKKTCATYNHVLSAGDFRHFFHPVLSAYAIIEV